MKFFTSDQHFNHGNELATEPKSGIMKFCPKTRPYETRKQMNEHLIESWNSVVRPQDEVYFLGDFAFRSKREEIEYFFNALNGQKELAAIGNHDHSDVKRLPWRKVGYGALLNIEGQKVHINHHPFVAGRWDSAHYGTYHLFGHVHGEPVYGDTPVRAMDVGVDAVGPVPLSWEQIHEKLSKIPVVVNHHQNN